ncbi:MAG: TIGR02391 family protein [Oscillospiraceae bacterium]|nr:TIGR02391 family protein [Oscillospiraceae bacterium]
MRNTYTNEIAELHKWVESTDYQLGTGFSFLHTEAEVQTVCRRIYFIANCIREEYPFYASQLPPISQRLFSGNPVNGFTLNSAVFGELFIIAQQLFSEPINAQFWTSIHPRISQISKELFCDGHFASAAEKAMKELETRLRELFQELKPSAGIPARIGDVIGALLGDNGIFNFCDTSTVSGKDYRRGTKSLFEGAFAAYRNPAAHANISCTKREAIEQIMLASQLMYILDKQ